MKNYFLLCLLFMAAFSSCLQDETFTPQGETVNLNVNKFIKNSDAYQALESDTPTKGWTDESFAAALHTFEYRLGVEIDAKMSNSSADLEFTKDRDLIAPVYLRAKLGPCSDQYIKEADTAGVVAYACALGTGGAGVEACIIAYATAMVIADQNYDRCIEETYPEAVIINP